MAEDMEEMLFLSTFLSGAKPIELLKQIFSMSISPLLITDAGHLDGGYRIIYANKAFCKLTGYELAELVGQSPRLLQGPDSRKDVIARLARDLKTTGYFRGMSYNYRKDGSCYPLEWDISPIRDNNGKILFFVSIQRDLTQVLKAARQMKEVNEHVRELITDVSRGKIAPEKLKEQSKPLIDELKDNAKLYTHVDDDDDDLFFDLDAEMDDLEQGDSKQAITAQEYLKEERLSEAELASMQECIKDVEEEIGFLAGDISQIYRVDDISAKLKELSDSIFFLIEFTDTALAVAQVAECVPSMTEQQLSGFCIEFLQSLIIEIENWVDGVFITQTATNIYDGAGNIIASARQITSMAKVAG